MKKFGLIPWKWSRYLASFTLSILVVLLQMRRLSISKWRYFGSLNFQNILFPVMLSIHELTTNPLKHVFLNNQRGERRIGYNSNSANESYTLDYRDNTVGIPDHVDLTHPEPFGMSRLFDLSKKVKETVTRIKESDTHYVISLPS